MTSILLGYEVGTGIPVSIPLRHMVVTGQTQEAGKTTTLEALIHRASRPAVAFVTKRGEQSFEHGHRIPPYFRERADWQFVASVLEAAMHEKLKFERAWIMRASKGAKTLADVHANVKRLGEVAKGLSADVYMTLDAYLDIVVPRVQSIKFATSLQLITGLNVVDLSSRDTFPPELQSLVMRSVIEWIYERADETITIIPEAWEFLPQGRGSPVKLAAAELIRKGAGLRNYVWLDSQDIGGVDKEVLRSCPVWLLGVQREANEINRVLDNIPAGIKKPKAADVATLEKGQFFACFGKHVIKTYVRPSWMFEQRAIAIARGECEPPVRTDIERLKLAIPTTETQIAQPIAEESPPIIAEEIEEMSAAVEDKLDVLIGLMTRNAAASPATPHDITAPQATLVSNVAPSEDEMYQRFKARLIKEAPKLLQVLNIKPVINVRDKEEVIEVDGSSLRGRVAKLIASGFFDQTIAGNAAFVELKRAGFSVAKPSVYRECDKLAEMGFLTKESDGYRAVDSMKANIKRK